jgi:hypothetical protein
VPSEPKKASSLKEFKKRKREEAAKAHKEWCLKFGFAVPDEASEDAGQPVTVTNPCNTGKSASIPPLKRTHVLPDIPSTPLGCIDTIGAMIRFPPVRKDIEKLRQQAGWTVVTRQAGTITEPCGTEKPIKAKLSLRRESDDLRVWIYNDGIRVEVSIPRVLGLTNDKQSRVTERQALDVFESITAKLFPLTTARAAVWGASHFGWRVTRLDLAKNFAADLPEVMEDLRFVHHPDIRAEPATHGRTGISIYGENYEVCLYRMRERMGRGVVRSSTKGKVFEPERASLVRFEFRFRTTKALDRLAKDLPIRGDGLPFLVTCADGTHRIVRLGFTNHLLQQILAREAQNLGSLTTRQLKGAESWKPLFRLGLLYLAEQPWAWSLVKENYGERRIRDLKKVVASIRLSKRDVELVRVIWPAPQVAPALRARLIEQRSRMPLRKMHS